MLRDRGEHARLDREHAAHRGSEHRCGHGPAVGGGEPWRAEEFCDAVDGEEGDTRDPDAAIGDRPERARSEHSSRRHADVVRGDDHAHRRERVTTLPDDHSVVQGLCGGEAVRDGDELDP